MSKVYVFAIGGTGSRILKSLTMLLAAGVKTSATEIVPIIIDPDAGCGDKTDTVLLMDYYTQLRNTLSLHNDGKISAFSTSLGNLGFPTPYVMPMGNNTNTGFGNYMRFGMLDNANMAMANMLFSSSNQAADMTIGFTGNPNIGSVVLNQFATSQEFATFAADFTQGDKIFIISSIFGGTGASGFPLLLKNLRNINPNLHIPNAADIQNAEIGALTVLPYFNITPSDTGVIDSDTFVSKTKAALSYYEKNLDGLNVLYYIGDNVRGQQEYNEGGANQRNEAHFIELAGALAILDFANNSVAGAPQTVYKEFGIENDGTNLTLKSLGQITYRQVAAPLTEFTLLGKYLAEHLHSSLSQEWLRQYKDSVVGGQLYNVLSQFTTMFLNWEKSLENPKNTRKFTPFVLDPRPDKVFELAKGIGTSKVMFVSASNWDLYDHFLNKGECAKVANQHGKSEDGKFLAHLLYGTKKVVSEKIRF